MSSVWAAAAARATGQCRSISGVVRHRDTCCDFLRRLVLLRRFVLPARRRGGLELGGHICHPLLFLCRLGSMQTLHSPHRFGRPLNICREAALPPARWRSSRAKECSWPRGRLAGDPVDRFCRICPLFTSQSPPGYAVQAACAVAPSPPDTLADYAPPRPLARPNHRLSTVKTRSRRRDPTLTCVQASMGLAAPLGCRPRRAASALRERESRAGRAVG